MYDHHQNIESANFFHIKLFFYQFYLIESFIHVSWNMSLDIKYQTCRCHAHHLHEILNIDLFLKESLFMRLKHSKTKSKTAIALYHERHVQFTTQLLSIPTHSHIHAEGIFSFVGPTQTIISSINWNQLSSHVQPRQYANKLHNLGDLPMKLLLLRVPLKFHDQKLFHPLVTHQSVEYKPLLKCTNSMGDGKRKCIYKQIYLPVPSVKNCTISTAKDQSTTIWNRMGHPDRLYFKRPSCKFPLHFKHLKSWWNKDPILL